MSLMHIEILSPKSLLNRIRTYLSHLRMNRIVYDLDIYTIGAELVPCYLFGNTHLYDLFTGGTFGRNFLKTLSRKIGFALIVFWGTLYVYENSLQLLNLFELLNANLQVDFIFRYRIEYLS